MEGNKDYAGNCLQLINKVVPFYSLQTIQLLLLARYKVIKFTSSLSPGDGEERERLDNGH